MPLWTEYIDPAELTVYARQELANQPANQNQLRRWFPSQFVADIDVEWETGIGGLAQAAMYRAYDAATRVSAMPGKGKSRTQLPPITDQIVVGEYERLRNQNNSDRRIEDVLERATGFLSRKVETRFEIARGYTIVNAGMAINENRLVKTNSYGRTGSRTATAPTLWSNTFSSDWINDLVNWVGLMSDENGEPPGCTLVSTKIRRLMLTNAAARGQLPVSFASDAVRVGESALNYLLEDNNLPPLFVYDKSYVDSTGTKRKIIDPNLLALLPAPVDPDADEGPLGNTTWGRPAEALNPEYDLQEVGEEGGIVALTFREDRPERVDSYVSAIGMPIMTNPDLSFIATVAA